MIDSSSTSERHGNAALRLLWMGALPVILLCVLFLTRQEAWTFSGYDVAVLALVAAAVVARAVDALRYGGTTAEGEPATRAHVVGYAVRVVGITGAGWMIAQSIAL